MANLQNTVIAGSLRLSSHGAGMVRTSANGTISSSPMTSADLPSHTHDDRYYTESESDARFFRKNTWEGNSYISTDGTFYGTIFYDSNNTGYYLDPAGTTNLNVTYTNYLYVNGSQITGDQITYLKNTLDSTSLPYKCDIYVDGDANTYYPVHFIWGDQDVWRRIVIKRGYSEEAPWDPIGTGAHRGGLLLDWEGNFGGWGGAEYSDRLRVFNESYTNVCADMYIYTHSMGYVFMLRGGHALYHIFSDQPIRGYHQTGTPDIAYNTSTLFYDHSNTSYRVYAPAPVTTVNSSRIDGLRTKKQSLFDNRYLRQGVDINGIGSITTTNSYATNFMAANAFYLNGQSYYLNSSNGGIYTNARFESASNIYMSGNLVATQAWVQAQGYRTTDSDNQTLSISGSTLSISGGNSVTIPSGGITSESDTLATVTGRGNTTGSNVITSAGMYAAVFYDYNNNTYFWDGSAGKSMEVAGGIQLDGLNNSNAYIAFNNASTYWGIIGNYGSNDWRIGIGNYGTMVDWNLRWDASGNAWANSSFRAPIFYDSNDTSYYVDPNSTSNLAASYIGRVLINYDGTDTWFRMQSGNRMRITTTGGTDFIIPNTGNMSYNGNVVWHAGNDGSGSGLDSDTTDGYHVGNSTNQIAYWDSSRNLYVNNPESYSGEVRLGAAWGRGGVYASSTLSLSTSSGNIDFVHGNNITARLVGNTGNYGPTFMLGTTSPDYTLIDGNIRPVVYLHGQYPVLTLNHTVTSNGSHGPTIQFTHHTADKQWVIGSNGTGTQLDIGYSTYTANRNPHNGIADYNGSTFFRIDNGGNIQLGRGNGRSTWVNDILYVGANDSGDAHMYFGEDSSNWYGLHWYWDSGYTVYLYGRNAGSDTQIMRYVTNDNSYVHWTRHFHMNSYDINYVNQIYMETGGQGNYIYANNSGTYGSMRLTSTRNGWYGIYFDSGSTLMMNSNETGFYRQGYGWQWRWENGTAYVNKNSYGGGTSAAVLDSSNYSSWAQPKIYQGQSDGNWQNFTNDVGEFRVDEVLNINGGSHSNQSPNVYTYGGVLSWRLNNHSFQLYASHTGDITFKTQWGNDNYSGWRRILHESNYNSWAPSLTGGGASGTWGISITGVASQVNINYNNDSNSTYQLLWGSGNSVYGTSQIYVNPSSDIIYARGGYISPGNPWGTSDSAFFPNGITTAGGTNWIYGRTYVGNAPGNGNGHQFEANGNMYSTGHHYLDSNYGQTIVGRYSSTVYQGVWAMGDSYKLPMDGSSTGSLYGLAWSHPNAGGVASNLNTHGLLVMENGTFLAAISGSIRARDDVRAPALYDSGSRVAISRSEGRNYVDYSRYVYNNGAYSGSGWVEPSDLGVRYAASANYATSAGSASSVSWSNVGSKPAGWLDTTNLISDHVPNASAAVSGFYQNYAGDGNPTGTWFNYINVRHSNPGNGHGFQLGMSYYDSHLWYRSYQGGTSPSFATWYRAYSDYYRPYADNSGALAGYGSSSYLNRNGTSYYQLDTWLQSTGTHGLYSTYNNFHLNPNADTSYTPARIYGSRNGYQGAVFGGADGWVHLMMNAGNWGIYEQGGFDWALYGSRNNYVTIGSSAVSHKLRVEGTIAATGDVIAYYSDARLKTDVREIENALDKVLAIRGVYYKPNDLSKQLGAESEPDKLKVGVLAQEIQAVLPEVIADAPFDIRVDKETGEKYSISGQNYMTVKYEKLVPLLIQAIKEQQKQIEELKSKLV
jgi:hypothetical protein